MSRPLPIAKLVPQDGWLADFCTYTRTNMMAPVEFQLGVGLAVLSATIGRGCWVRLGAKRWYPHIWIVLVGGAGANKSTPVYTALDFITQQVGSDAILPRRWSPEAFFAALAKTPDGFWNVGELGGWLGGAGRDYMRGAREDLCDLWDSPPAWKRATRKDDTPPIERAAFTAVASARPADFEDAAGLTDFSSGFLSRFLLINAETKGAYRGLSHVEGVTDDLADAARNQILSRLHQIGLWKGGDHRVTFDPDAEAAWEAFDRRSIGEADDVPELLHGWAKRRGIQALKLAVLHALSRHHKPEVSGLDVAWGCAVIDSSWASVKAIALDRIGLDRDAQRRQRVTEIAQQIARDNGGWISVRDVLRKTRLIRNKKDLDQWVETWRESGEFVVGEMRTAERGPPARALLLAGSVPPRGWDGPEWRRLRAETEHVNGTRLNGNADTPTQSDMPESEPLS